METTTTDEQTGILSQASATQQENSVKGGSPPLTGLTPNHQALIIVQGERVITSLRRHQTSALRQITDVTHCNAVFLSRVNSDRLIIPLPLEANPWLHLPMKRTPRLHHSITPASLHPGCPIPSPLTLHHSFHLSTVLTATAFTPSNASGVAPQRSPLLAPRWPLGGGGAGDHARTRPPPTAGISSCSPISTRSSSLSLMQSSKLVAPGRLAGLGKWDQTNNQKYTSHNKCTKIHFTYGFN
jgi:hypothetical protein